MTSTATAPAAHAAASAASIVAPISAASLRAGMMTEISWIMDR
jgi:hypothetical protein